MISHRRFVVTGLAFVFAAGLGSSSIAQELPKLKEKKTYKVGFAQTESNNPWRLAETESVKSEAAKRGYQLVYTDAAGSAAKQVADVNSMIAQGVDVILLAPREEKPLVPAVMAAKKAGIPVILLDRRVDPVAVGVHQGATALGNAGATRVALVEDDDPGGAGRLRVEDLDAEVAATTLDQRDPARREVGEVGGLAAA